MTMNTYSLKNISYLFMLALLLSGAGLIHTKFSPPKIVISKQSEAINVNNELVRLFSSGLERFISSFLWVTTLIESDVEKYNKRDQNSWMFLRFKSITELDPKFLRAYQFGGKYLSIVKDDLVGAKYIFEKGLSTYPNNYELLFNYAFLLAFEIYDYKNAVIYYKKLTSYPQAPHFLKSLIPKLMYQQQGSLKEVFPIVLSIFNNEPEGTFLKKKLKKDLYAIKAEIDLTCLNNKEFNCDRYDINGDPYIKKGDNFVSPKPFKRYKLFKKN